MDIFTAFTDKSDGNINDISNQLEFLKKHNLSNKNPINVDQKHTNRVYVIDENYQYQIADAMITNRKDIALFTRVADCQPILLWDENTRVIAAVHAGREGVYKNILKETITVMRNSFHSRSQDINILIGPSAKKCCYEVGRDSNEHIDYVLSNFGEEFIYDKNIDLNGMAIQQLLNEGINRDNIDVSTECTACNNEKYFSYRKGDKK